MQNSGIGPLFLPVCWSAIISVVRWAADSGQWAADQRAADQWTKIAACPPLIKIHSL